MNPHLSDVVFSSMFVDFSENQEDSTGEFYIILCLFYEKVGINLIIYLLPGSSYCFVGCYLIIYNQPKLIWVHYGLHYVELFFGLYSEVLFFLGVGEGRSRGGSSALPVICCLSSRHSGGNLILFLFLYHRYTNHLVYISICTYDIYFIHKPTWTHLYSHVYSYINVKNTRQYTRL